MMQSGSLISKEEKLGYKSYGSMYMDERTPDGCLVDKNGVWDGKMGMEKMDESR